MTRFMATLRRRSVSFWLAACAGVLVILLVVQAVRYAGADDAGKHLRELVAEPPAAPGRGDVSDIEQYKAIGEKGCFGKKSTPKPQLFGVMGEVALLGGSPKDAKPYAVDAQLPGGFKLLEIHPNSVVIEKDGSKETLTLFPELGGARPTPPPSPPRTPPPAEGAAKDDSQPAPEPEETGPAPGEQEDTVREIDDPRAIKELEVMRKLEQLTDTQRGAQ